MNPPEGAAAGVGTSLPGVLQHRPCRLKQYFFVERGAGGFRWRGGRIPGISPRFPRVWRRAMCIPLRSKGYTSPTCILSGKTTSESAETTQSQREPLRVSGFSSESAQTQPDRPARCGFEDSVPGAALIRDSESIKLNPESTETVQSQRKPTQSQRKPLRVSENHSELADSAGSAQSQPDRPARCEFDDSVSLDLTLSLPGPGTPGPGLSVYLPDEVPAPSGSERAWISTSPAPVLRRDRIVVPVGGNADRNVVASGRGARTEMLIPAFAGRGQTLPDQTRPVSTSPAPVLRRRSTGAGEVPAWIRTRPDQKPPGSVLRRCRYFAGARMLFQSGGTRIECCNLRSGSADRNVVTCGRGTRTGMHAGE
eukprot:gene22455-biopygen19252